MSTTLRLSKYYICTTPQPDDLDEAAFELLDFVEISNVVTLPQHGITTNMVYNDFIDTDVSKPNKGYSNAGTSQLVVGNNPTDAGQIAVKAAALTRFTYAFKKEFSDAPDTDTTNTVSYSRALIDGPMDQGGGGEEFDNLTFEMAFAQRPVVVDPTAII